MFSPASGAELAGGRRPSCPRPRGPCPCSLAVSGPQSLAGPRARSPCARAPQALRPWLAAPSPASGPAERPASFPGGTPGPQLGKVPVCLDWTTGPSPGSCPPPCYIKKHVPGSRIRVRPVPGTSVRPAGCKFPGFTARPRTLFPPLIHFPAGMEQSRSEKSRIPQNILKQIVSMDKMAGS